MKKKSNNYVCEQWRSNLCLRKIIFTLTKLEVGKVLQGEKNVKVYSHISMPLCIDKQL